MQQKSLAICLLLTACTIDADDGAFEDLAELEQGLNGAPSLRWPGNPATIPVCWENPSEDATFLDDGTLVTEATMRSWAREVVEGQWSRYARINFTRWGTCTPGEPGIHIQITRTGGGASGFGPSMSGVTNGMRLGLHLHDGGSWCRANLAQFERCLKRLPLHEFGHALGFGHQENRADYVQTNPHPDCKKQIVGADQLLGAYDLQSTMSYCGQPGDQPWTFKTVLSPGDIAAVQKAYGRRVPGQLVGTRGADMMATNISPNPTFLWDADEAPGQKWTYNWARQAFEVQTNGQSGCLDTYPSAVHGSNLVSFPCFYDSFQKFRLDDVQLRGWGGLCLETPGTYANGTAVRVGTCTDDLRQRWSIDTLRRVRLVGTNSCLTWSPTVGASLFMWDCGGSANQSFDMLADGSLAFSGGSRCVDVQGPSTAQYVAGVGLPRSGDRVQTYTCVADQQNQKWNIGGRVTHSSGLCVDHQSSNQNGTAVQLRNCNNSDAQRWDYYWR